MVKQHGLFPYSVWLNQRCLNALNVASRNVLIQIATINPIGVKLPISIQIMTYSDMNVSNLFFLPILFTGFLILGVCFAFCCYLLRTTGDDYDIDLESPRRIRYDGLRQGNYRKKWFKKVSLKSDTCAICLDDFIHKEEISICRCGHAYHHKCIMKWMEIKETCPICQRNCRCENNNGSERTPLLTNPLDI
ncbi:RING finger protein 122 [Stylophora pistillata]|uniref:RING finger protein 122 n=2 Tax=Stylophora pistillata TaxID=50429 RepID=A0A2B4S5B9_STYPI|nr:RING finger protein 122 [Stylophora pistillata]